VTEKKTALSEYICHENLQRISKLTANTCLVQIYWSDVETTAAAGCHATRYTNKKAVL